jgi:hypothetical protein
VTCCPVAHRATRRCPSHTYSDPAFNFSALDSHNIQFQVWQLLAGDAIVASLSKMDVPRSLLATTPFVTHSLPKFHGASLGPNTVPVARAGHDQYGWYISNFLAFKAMLDLTKCLSFGRTIGWGVT